MSVLRCSDHEIGIVGNMKVGVGLTADVTKQEPRMAAWRITTLVFGSNKGKPAERVAYCITEKLD